VFLDFREVQGKQYAQLAARLNGRGVPSIDEAMREIVLQPVLEPFRELVNASMFRRLIESAHQQTGGSVPEAVEQKVNSLLHAAAQIADSPIANRQLLTANLAQEIPRKLEAVLQLPTLTARFPLPRSRKYKWASDYLTTQLRDDPVAWPTLLGWLFVHALGKVVSETGSAQTSRAWIDEWLLGKVIACALRNMGLDESATWHAVETIKLLTGHQCWHEMETPKTKRAREVLRAWLGDGDVQRFLQVNRYEDVLWFNKEAFDQLLWSMFAIATVAISANPSRPVNQIAEEIVACYDIIRTLERAEEKSGYEIERLLEATS
jgi:hypothetical protein